MRWARQGRWGASRGGVRSSAHGRRGEAARAGRKSGEGQESARGKRSHLARAHGVVGVVLGPLRRKPLQPRHHRVRLLLLRVRRVHLTERPMARPARPAAVSTQAPATLCPPFALHPVVIAVLCLTSPLKPLSVALLRSGSGGGEGGLTFRLCHLGAEDLGVGDAFLVGGLRRERGEPGHGKRLARRRRGPRALGPLPHGARVSFRPGIAKHVVLKGARGRGGCELTRKPPRRREREGGRGRGGTSAWPHEARALGAARERIFQCYACNSARTKKRRRRRRRNRNGGTKRAGRRNRRR